MKGGVFMQQIISLFLSWIMMFLSLFGFNLGGGGTTTEPTPAPFTPKAGMEQTFAYGSADTQKLDLYLPAGKTSASLILFLHGGAWVTGSKESYTYDAKKWQAMGYATASMNYRFLGDGVLFSEQLADITAALNAIVQTARYNGVTLTKAAFVGMSAGAHLALLYAYTKAAESPLPPAAVISSSAPTDFTDPAFIRNSDMVQSVITNIGLDPNLVASTLESGLAEAFLPVLRNISPAKQVTASSVPTLMAHGTADTIVPYSNALRLDAALTNAGVRHNFVTFQDAGHALVGDAAASALFQTLTAQYIAAYLN